MGSSTSASPGTHIGRMCVYRPPSSTVSYLDDLCTGFDQATDSNRDVFILGDFNINWKDHNNSNRTKLMRYAKNCGLKQMVNDTTRSSISWVIVQIHALI